MTPLDRLPRHPLAILPTPLRPAPNLSRALGVEVWIKRDDLTGLAFGGNKVRSAEYLVGDAVARGATVIVTTAAAQSNFCRVMAAAGRVAGLRVTLLLRGRPEARLQGNLLLDRLLGAEIRFTDDPDPYSVETRDRLTAWVEELRAGGERPYLIYMHDESLPAALAAAAHVQTGIELEAQCADAGIRPRHLYLAAGSGSTVAGLALGTRGARHVGDARTVGVCVGALPDVLRPNVRRFVARTADLLELPAGDGPRIELDGSQRGEAYGLPTDAALEAIRLLAQTDAIVLNPVYTGKAFAALLADVARGTVRRGETVVFMHTGGDPLVFAHAETLAGFVSAPAVDSGTRLA